MIYLTCFHLVHEFGFIKLCSSYYYNFMFNQIDQLTESDVAADWYKGHLLANTH